MKFRIILMLLLQMALAGFANAESLTTDQQEIKRLIKKMYSYDPDTFEFGNFGGHYQPKKLIELYKNFFDDSYVDVVAKKAEPNLGEFGDVRYPSIGEEQLKFEPLPKIMIMPAVVERNKAKIAVIVGPELSNQRRSLYFLTKTDHGWRISNVMMHSVWPDVDDRTHNCYFEFARPPSADEKKEILPHCR